MPKVIVYVPAAAWRKLEAEGLDPAVAVREFARRGYEVVDGQLPERERPASGDGVTSAPVETGREVASTPGDSRSESRLCGMSNRHHMNSPTNPCPRCGYPT